MTWDDHEFSDDAWDAHANYTGGRQDELQVERRRNAELAFFEYLPLDPDDVPEGVVELDAMPRYPDTRIWRSCAIFEGEAPASDRLLNRR